MAGPRVHSETKGEAVTIALMLALKAVVVAELSDAWVQRSNTLSDTLSTCE